MNQISNYIVPIFVLAILLYALKKKVNIYESFLVGAKEGLITTFKIAPAVIAMVFAINIFLNSHLKPAELPNQPCLRRPTRWECPIL